MDKNPCKDINVGSESINIETASIDWIYNLLVVLDGLSHIVQGSYTFQAVYEVGITRKISDLKEVKVFFQGRNVPIQNLGKLSSKKEPDIPSNLIEECDLRDLVKDEFSGDFMQK